MREIKIPKVVLAYGIVIAMILSGFGTIAATTHRMRVLTTNRKTNKRQIRSNSVHIKTIFDRTNF